jgi:hypothetical protein
VIAIGVEDGTSTEAGAFARSPLAGRVTTELLVVDGVAWLGVEETGRRELRAVALD